MAWRRSGVYINYFSFHAYLIEFNWTERWPSGRRRWTGIPVTSSRVFVGSNPTLSATAMVIRAGSFATTNREPRQARKGAAVTARSGAEDIAGADHLPAVSNMS